MDIEKRFRHGELYSRDSIHFADSLMFKTLRRQKTVYGGGGIMPDEFVPLDTTQYTFYHRQLSLRGIINTEILTYVDNNRKALKKKYASLSEFEENFTVPQQLLDAIYAEGEKQKVKLKDEAEREASLTMLVPQLKALIARDLWDMSAYFKIVNEQNHIVRAGVRALGYE